MLGLGPNSNEEERRGSGLNDSWLSDFIDEGYQSRKDEKAHVEMELDFSTAENVSRDTSGSAEFTAKSEEHKRTNTQHHGLPKSPAALAQAIRNTEMERFIEESLSSHTGHGHHHHRRDGHHGHTSVRKHTTNFHASLKPALERDTTS